MRADVAGAGLVVIAAVIGARYLGERAEPAAATPVEAVASLPGGAPAQSSYYSSPKNEVRISAGAHNQYFVTAIVNRREAMFLVDTGASFVALRESDASVAGIRTVRADFNQPVRTANGETRAALVRIRTMEIGGIRLDDVDAFILPDNQLAMNLLGMSFLSRLTSVETRSGELILRG